MNHKVLLVQPFISPIDTVTFESEGKEITIRVDAFVELATKIGWNNKIMLIKILRGFYCTEDRPLSLLFTKQIVEWLIEKFEPKAF